MITDVKGMAKIWWKWSGVSVRMTSSWLTEESVIQVGVHTSSVSFSWWQNEDRCLVFEREGVSRLQLRSPIIAIHLLAASARSHTVKKVWLWWRPLHHKLTYQPGLGEWSEHPGDGWKLTVIFHSVWEEGFMLRCTNDTEVGWVGVAIRRAYLAPWVWFDVTNKSPSNNHGVPEFQLVPPRNIVSN